jgi:hypothetical protein
LICAYLSITFYTWSSISNSYSSIYSGWTLAMPLFSLRPRRHAEYLYVRTLYKYVINLEWNQIFYAYQFFLASQSGCKQCCMPRYYIRYWFGFVFHHHKLAGQYHIHTFRWIATSTELYDNW